MADKLYEEADTQAIAAAIKSKSGNDATMKVSQMASRINGIQTEGGNEINAPGGTATAGDMARGKTAYVENNLLTGNVETAESGNTKTLNRGTVRYSSGTGTVKVPVFIFKSGANTKQLLFREGSYAEFDALASQFGDAVDENVLNGKIYTSKNGFAKKGTHVCAKPSGTIEITTNGTHNVSAYASASVNVQQTTGGLIKKTGSVTVEEAGTEFSFDTGLTNITAIQIDAATGTAPCTYRWVYTDGKYTILGKQTYITSVNTSAPYLVISGGSVTPKQVSGTYPINADTYNWVAIGT